MCVEPVGALEEPSLVPQVQVDDHAPDVPREGFVGGRSGPHGSGAAHGAVQRILACGRHGCHRGVDVSPARNVVLPCRMLVAQVQNLFEMPSVRLCRTRRPSAPLAKVLNQGSWPYLGDLAVTIRIAV